ncbi:MAG: DUF2157 domain-containing protein [Candidatus Polarisedimenticolia bacterium]
MTLPDKESAQQRADRIRAFRAELEQLEREGVLSLPSAERERLVSHHQGLLEQLASQFDIDVSDTQRQMSLGMRVASFLGALALAAAVYTFFFRFWGLLGTSVQVTLLVAAPLAALAGVPMAARRERTLYVASLIATVALASFVLNLGVLGAIFNITPSQHALLAWSLFAGLLAWGYGLRLLHAASLVALILWIASCVGVFRGIPWDMVWRRPESALLAGAAVFAAPLLVRRAPPGFHADHRLIGLIAILIPVLILGFTGEMSWIPLKAKTVENLYQILGFALSSAAIALGIRRGWTEVVRVGAVGFVVFLYIKLFDWWWEWMPRYLFFLILGAIALAILVILRRARAVLQRSPA